MSRTWLKWMPAVAVPAVIVAGVLAVPLQAGAAVDLPEKTPQDVLELAAGSTVDTFSGTLEQTSELGLPEMPSTADAAPATSPTPSTCSPATTPCGCTRTAPTRAGCRCKTPCPSAT